MTPTRRIPLVLVTLVVLLSFARAQEPQVPSAQQLESAVKTALVAAGQGESELRDTLNRAQTSLGVAAEARTKLEQFEAAIAEVPALLASLREELARPAEDPNLGADPNASLEELETRLGQARAEQAGARSQVDELDQIAAKRARRRTEIPDELVAAQQALKADLEALRALSVESETDARRLLLQAQVVEHRAVEAALLKERETYEARSDLLPLRRDRAQRSVVRAEKAVAFWQQQVGARRAAEGEAAAREAEQQLEAITRRFPELQDVAARTRELTAMRSGEESLPRQISRAQEDLEDSRTQLDEVERRFRAARRRIAAGGLTESMGIILRRDYEWLPQPRELVFRAQRREQELSHAQLQLITIEEARSDRGDLETAVEGLLASLDSESSPQLENVARRLLTTQREAQDAVLSELNTLTSVRYATKDVDVLLLSTVRSYRLYIEERILWVRSSPDGLLDSARVLPTHFAELTTAVVSVDWLGELEAAARGELAWSIVLGLAFLVLTAGRRTLRRLRTEMATRVRSYRTDRYLYTVRGLIQTALLSLQLPLLAGSVGWLLTHSEVDLVAATGSGLFEMSKAWVVLRFTRGLFADKGVGQAHFRWPSHRLQSMRREFHWFIPTAMVLGLFVETLGTTGAGNWNESLGRLAFFLEMCAITVAVNRLFRREGEFWAKALSRSERSLMVRTHRMWGMLATALPALIGLLALLGFYYTARQFELRLKYTIVFALALVLINALLLRWLYMARRRLAVEQALEARARKEEEERADEPTPESGMTIDADQVDIPAVDAQTRRLFQSSITLATMVGLFLIWSNVLPALQRLDRVQIWPEVTLLSAEDEALGQLAEPVARAAEPSTSAESGGTSLPLPTARPTIEESGGDQAALPASLTLADLLLALVFVLFTSLAAKNLPAFLELALLQRLPLDGGSRYAVSTIVRYLILLIGVSAVSSALGIGWQQIQWLAAALTFGLAFGLQEIFANFVSGLIILLERPIRVGDVVTVAGIEGRVTQLRMRATTIQDYDRRELLVPNKEFITGSVINWSLTDPITRIIIPVGIAYGSDTKLAHKLLLDVAKKNKLILDEPAPVALFRSFGASSLDFELRVFLAARDYWVDATDQLHTGIDQAFRKANIEIAFPQRDIHIRSVVERGGPVVDEAAGGESRPQ